MTDGNRDETSGIGEPFGAYLDDVFNRVPLWPRFKTELREELQTHLEDAQEELLDLGYKPYAADDRVLQRMERPAILADQYNRMESLNSWFRDPVCLRSLAWVSSGYLAFVVLTKLFILILGFSVSDFQIAYDLERHLIDARWILALLSGFVAYSLYYAWSKNPYRFTPFVMLSVATFILTNMFEFQINFISPFPNMDGRIFLMADLPQPAMHFPFVIKTLRICELELTGAAIKVVGEGIHLLISPYPPDATITTIVYFCGLALATTYVAERLKQRQSFEVI